MDKQVVYEFQRNENERIRATVSDYKNKLYVDFRVFFSDVQTGESKPTKKGLTLPYALLPQLKNAVTACERTLSRISSMSDEYPNDKHLKQAKHSFTERG